jgi:hypothetical protein
LLAALLAGAVFTPVLSAQTEVSTATNSAADAIHPGEIRAALVEGDVQLVYPQGQSSPLKVGSNILPGLTVRTGANSTALLVLPMAPSRS